MNYQAKVLARKRLSKTVVNNAEPKEKRYYITDTVISGFRLCIYPTGAKSYVLDYRMGKGRKFKTQRLTIGSAQKFVPDQAREKAKFWLARIIGGEDPRAIEKKL